MDFTSAIIGFLIGAATGAAGTYFGHKYTDRRRKQEAAADAKKQFLAVKAQMPELIAEMKEDLQDESGRHVREFFVLESKRQNLGACPRRRFVYYAEDHGDLHGKLSILENRGYLCDVTPGDTPVFRMTEEFVELVSRYS